jgi:DNA-binding GntR family transcriptional regulator
MNSEQFHYSDCIQVSARHQIAGKSIRGRGTSLSNSATLNASTVDFRRRQANMESRTMAALQSPSRVRPSTRREAPKKAAAALATGRPEPTAAASGPPTALLRDEVLAVLRDRIAEGELRPGAHLNERVLCEQLRVSRTPLREAMRILAREGLIELLPHRGARVSELTLADVQHLFEVLAPLEATAGRLACERITAEALAEIKHLHRRMSAHFLGHKLGQYLQLNRAIHDRIVQAAANPVLLSTHRMVSDRLLWACFLYNEADEARWEEAMREHEQIVCALERRAGDELATLLQLHLQNMFEAIRQHTANPEAGAVQ